MRNSFFMSKNLPSTIQTGYGELVKMLITPESDGIFDQISHTIYYNIA